MSHAPALSLTLDLFTAPPASRAKDPESSKAAEHKVTASGSRKAHAEQVLELVRLYPGRTSKQISELALQRGHSGINRHEAARRLADLKNTGHVVQEKHEGARECTWRLARKS